MTRPQAFVLVCVLLTGACNAQSGDTSSSAVWTERERHVLASMSILPAIAKPHDPSNRVAGDRRAVTLGKALFFDPRLSGNGAVSCATCHQPGRYFTDGLQRSHGIGTTLRNSPTVIGAAYNRWFYWDGRRDSLWAQALIPFESSDEMGSSRLATNRHIANDDNYRAQYESLFGAIPAAELNRWAFADAGPLGKDTMRKNWNTIPLVSQKTLNGMYANIGKAIAAYEMTLLPTPVRFDRYVAAIESGKAPGHDDEFNAAEIAGAKLFMDAGKTQCLQCHNGPMGTNGDFQNIGSGNFTVTPAEGSKPAGSRLDFGRVFGLRAVLMDEFNCLGPYSDAKPEQCTTLRYLNTDAHVPIQGAFKVPGLRGLAKTAPYFHDGRFKTLSEVLDYYNHPPSMQVVGPHELRELNLTKTELGNLEAFLLTFSD